VLDRSGALRRIGRAGTLPKLQRSGCPHRQWWSRSSARPRLKARLPAAEQRHLGTCAHCAGIRPHFVNPDAVAQRRNPFINRDRKTSIRACRYRGNEAIVEIKPQRDARTRLAAHVELAARLCLDRLHNRPSALTLPAAIPRRWVCSASSGPRPAARSRSAKAPPLRSVWTWPVCRRAVAHATSGRKCLREAGAAP